MSNQSAGINVRDRHYARRKFAQTFKPGDRVYSKRCSSIAGFDGIIVAARGAGFQVFDPKTNNTYQRDHYDLIAIEKSNTAS